MPQTQPRDTIRLLVRAVLTLSEEARWEALDLVARRGAAAAVDLLRGHSGELALSPLARDQLIGVALDQAAASIEAGSAVARVDLSEFLSPQPLPEPTCADLRRAAERGAASRSEELSLHARGLVAKQHGPGAASRRRTALALRQDAALNRLLWCDERIVLNDCDRALMLASVDFIDHAAEMLIPRPWWRTPS